ncbi:MAG TPA: phosphate/phosphite/phosphonate ABC transporter substrate-binding protein, partial [Candidatus Methanoperedens sp.]|nr:phosphate/phosphite/phosphonate ABC transporter substrate-binding protein [Candidatus Methanoperedens sp.]
YYSPERMWQLYTPFIEYLRRETGEPWELRLVSNHEAMLEAVCGGQVDVAFLGPVPLGRAYRRCGVVPFLLALGKDGSPVYRAMLLTSDPAVTAAADLRGRKVGFFRGSTAAHVLPAKMLADAGLGPGSYQPVFLESQDRLMTALLLHEIAGAGVKETLYRRFEKEPIRLLQVSEPLPSFALAALPAQPPAVRERLVAVLLKLRPAGAAPEAETVCGWDDEVRNGFVAVSPDFLPAVLRLQEIAEKLLHDGR